MYKFNGGKKNNVCDILTGDKTWLHNHDPKHGDSDMCDTDNETTKHCCAQNTQMVTVHTVYVQLTWSNKHPKSENCQLPWCHENV